MEDVKTVLRMLPLFVCMLASGIPTDHEWSFFGITLATQQHLLVSHLANFPLWMVIVLIPPLYQLVLYPLFYNSIPTMLQRSGIGLLLNMIAVGSYLVLDTIGHVMISQCRVHD